MLARLAVLVAVVVAIGFLWAYLPIADLVHNAQEHVLSLGVAGFVLFALAYVLITLVVGPAVVLTASAGLVWGPLTGLIAVLVSATLAAVVTFLLGRFLIRDRVQAFAAKDRRMLAVVRAVTDGSWRIVLLLRMSPLLPFGVQNYLLSITDVRLFPYTWATTLGILPSSGLYVYLGSLGSDTSATGPLRWVLLGLGLAAAGLVVFIVTRRAQQALEQATHEGLSSK